MSLKMTMMSSMKKMVDSSYEFFTSFMQLLPLNLHLIIITIKYELI